MQKIDLPCVLLAGGKSQRMGEDKTKLAFNGFSLAEWLYKRLCRVYQTVYIVSKNIQKFDFDARFIIESSNIYTPIVGIITSFEMLKVPQIIVISVDTPFISEESLCLLAKTNATIVFAKSSQKSHYLLAKWHIDTLQTLKNAIKAQQYALYKIVEQFACKSIKISNQESFNINTPQEYKKALSILESQNNKLDSIKNENYAKGIS